MGPSPGRGRVRGRGGQGCVGVPWYRLAGCRRSAPPKRGRGVGGSRREGVGGGRPCFWRAGVCWREGMGSASSAVAGGSVRWEGVGGLLLRGWSGCVWGEEGVFFIEEGLGGSVPRAACPVPVPGSFAAAWLWLQLKLCLGDRHKHSRDHLKSFRLLFPTIGEDPALAPLCLSFPRHSRE